MCLRVNGDHPRNGGGDGGGGSSVRLSPTKCACGRVCVLRVFVHYCPEKSAYGTVSGSMLLLLGGELNSRDFYWSDRMQSNKLRCVVYNVRCGATASASVLARPSSFMWSHIDLRRSRSVSPDFGFMLDEGARAGGQCGCGGRDKVRERGVDNKW